MHASHGVTPFPVAHCSVRRRSPPGDELTLTGKRSLVLVGCADLNAAVRGGATASLSQSAVQQCNAPPTAPP